LKSIDLLTQKKHIYFYSQLRFLRSDELFYIRVESLENISEEHHHFILAALGRSKHVVLSIPIREFENTELIASYFNKGIKGFSVRVKHDAQKLTRNDGIGRLGSGDDELVEWFGKYKHSLPLKRLLVFEFDCQDHDTRGLGATIINLYKKGMKWWLVLNIEGPPDDFRAKNYRDLLDYIKIRNCTRINVYFPFWSEHFKNWDLKTHNTFSGIEYVHIDLSNKCTHSCEFCALYGQDATADIKERSQGVIPQYVSSYMKQEIDRDKCLEILESLPWSVKCLQFGGAGDPMMHESAIDFIAVARNKGLRVEILSNMEYITDKDITRLHDLGGINLYDLHFIVNISGATPDTYVKTRPRQTEKNFHKVVATITELSRLRRKSMNYGVNFTLMCVVTTNNCHELVEMIELARETGARKVWFKPLELHLPIHKSLVPKSEQMPVVIKNLSQALKLADDYGIEIVDRQYPEQLIKQNQIESVWARS
jgi:wyosine [tRNA(Phe)-imidazoG37] synthetase (radical SAM superfamily)